LYAMSICHDFVSCRFLFFVILLLFSCKWYSVSWAAAFFFSQIESAPWMVTSATCIVCPCCPPSQWIWHCSPPL
jgi:hypothetical protein